MHLANVLDECLGSNLFNEGGVLIGKGGGF